jgi:hypothetical protein
VVDAVHFALGAVPRENFLGLERGIGCRARSVRA